MIEQYLIQLIREFGSFAVIVWLIVFEIPAMRRAINNNTLVMQRLLDERMRG